MLAPSLLISESLKIDFTDVNSFTDFSVSGLSEEKTQSIFKAELLDELAAYTQKRLEAGQVLSITFTDVDMAGDIQPWRNRYNADIRYIEAIYPPRLTFTYTLTDDDGEVMMEGEAAIKDLTFQMSSGAMVRHRFSNFPYESELLKDWIRKTLVKPSSADQG